MKIGNRDLRDALAAAEERGWQIVATSKSHIKLTHPSGAVVFAGSSPSDRRAIRNMEARLRRVERGEQP